MPDSQIDLFWSSLFIQTVMKYIWYNHQPVPHVCRQTANKNARKLRVSEFVSSCGPLVSLVSWGGDEDSSDSWCDWLSTEMPLYIMSCIFTTPLMLQGLTRAVTCLLLLLSIKMYPQLGEVYPEKNGNSRPLWCVVEFPKMSSSTTRWCSRQTTVVLSNKWVVQFWGK